MNQLAYAFIDFIAKAFVVVSRLFYGGKGCAFAFFSEIFFVLPALSLAAGLSFVQLELCRTKFVPVFGTLLGDRGFHGFQSSLRVSNRLGNWSWFRVLALPAYPSDHEPPANSKLNLNAADHFAYEGNNHNGSDASFPTMIDSAELFAFLLLSAASCFYRVPWR